MALSTQPYKGARDFYPEDKRLQKFLFSVMRDTVEKFGYEEYDAPILEPIELYLSKSNEEIVNEQTYSFTDRGDRKVTLRPEMTPSVSRMVAGRRQELGYPLRWYSIPNLWRYERPQHGRLREHWQLNVDLFGVDNVEADLEIIQVADAIMNAFGATDEMYTIKVSSRRLLDVLMTDYLKLSDVQRHTLRGLIDRMHKIDESEFLADADALLTPTQRDEGLGERLFQLLSVTSIDELPSSVSHDPAVFQLRLVLTQLKELMHIDNAVFDITLVRGFDYYNDIVFEMFDNHPDNNRAMFGGGRYDGLVSLFGVEPVASIGFGMGDVTLQSFLKLHELLPELTTETDAYVIMIGDVFGRAYQIISDMREMGLKLAVDISERKTDKQIATAVKKAIPYVIFIGEKELAEEQYTLKDLHTGKEESHSTQRIVSMIKDYRKHDRD